MAEDADDGKGHAGKVAERVADKGVRRVPASPISLQLVNLSRVGRRKGQPHQEDLTLSPS